MATTVDYSGRKTDLFIFQGAGAGGDKPIRLAFGDAGQVTTGIQKLAQTFAMLFLTEAGSVPDKPDWGTEFLAAVRNGMVNNENDVQSAVSMAIEDVRGTLGLIAEQESYPPDETFQSASLLNYTLDEKTSKLTMYIKVVSAAGDSRVVVLPVSAPIG